MIKIRHFFFILLNLVVVQVYSQNLVSADLLRSRPSTQVHNILEYYGLNTAGLTIPAVNSYKITYSTTDVHGNATIATGAVFIPQMASCNALPLLSWQHGTEYDKTNVASQDNGDAILGFIFSSHGYVVVMPDYLGMGDNEGIHPYHHWLSEATASIDLIKACREFITNLSGLNDNNQLFLAGYSQGGHATMALHKYIQENNLYDEFNVVASAPMSGAYDLSGAQYDLIFNANSSYYRAEFLPYILGGYQEVYGTIYNSYNQLYKTPYDSLIGEYLSKNYTWAEWAAMVPENYSEFMQDSVLENMQADSLRIIHPINWALRLNNLYNWVPERPVDMLYCGMDSMVSAQNSLNTLDSMVALGATKINATEIDPNGVHETCFFPSIGYALNWFDSLAEFCQVVANSPEINSADKFTVYPNPAKNNLFIDCSVGLEVTLFSLDGRVAIKTTQYCGNPLNISDLTPGVYVILALDPVRNKNYQSLFIKN